MVDHSLAVQDEQVGLNPTLVVQEARHQATVLMDVVEQQKLYVTIGRKKHLVAEAWQTICAFNNANPITEWVKPIEEDGVIKAWQARVVLYQHGKAISSGEMVCGLEEFPCRGKDGFAKHRAAQSAAMTWAMAKAARMKFAWVAVLGGYAPTPAEEILGSPVEEQSPRPASVGTPPAFNNKGQVMSWYGDHHSLLISHIRPFFPEGKLMADLTIEELVSAAEQAVAQAKGEEDAPRF